MTCYLQNNKVNYLDSSHAVVYNGTITVNDKYNFVNTYASSPYERGYTRLSKNINSTNTLLVKWKPGTKHNTLYYTLHLPFTCSDITALQNKTVTVTANITDNAGTHTFVDTYPLKHQFVNTINIFKVYKTDSYIKAVNIYASADIALMLLQPRKLFSNNDVTTVSLIVV